MVDAHAGQIGDTDRPVGRTELVSLLARLAGLLDLAPTEDTRLPIARLRATSPRADCVLRHAEEAAYAPTADRMNRLWALGSCTDR